MYLYTNGNVSFYVADNKVEELETSLVQKF